MMKRQTQTYDEELKLVETINKMSSQIHISDQQYGSAEHSKFLAEVIEHLEDQLDSIRKSRQLTTAV